jgi:hypothetical protein
MEVKIDTKNSLDFQRVLVYAGNGSVLGMVGLMLPFSSRFFNGQAQRHEEYNQVCLCKKS